jgi:hypothetical protein
MNIDNTQYAPDTPEQVREWFPEVDEIGTDSIRESVITACINHVPEYFWYAPAAKYHHPENHRVRHGLVLHVKRVCTAWERKAKSMVKQNHMDWRGVDVVRAAALLHDTFKYGRPPTDVSSTTSSHDMIAGNYYRDNTDLPNSIITAIKQHMGPWGAGPNPSTHEAQMLHMADLEASDKNSTGIAIKEPNDILQQQFPTVGER